MARRQKQGAEMMLVDSDRSVHMTGMSQRVSFHQPSNIGIAFGHYSKVHASQNRVWKFMWQTQDRANKISLVDGFVSENPAMFVRSVPALVRKEIEALLLPGKARFIDLLDKVEIRGTVIHAEDGLWYI